MQDDVEEYLYRLLPERDEVVNEMEKYAAENDIPSSAGGGSHAGAFRAVSEQSGFSRWLGNRLLHNLGWRRQAEGQSHLHGRRSGKSAAARDYFRRAGVPSGSRYALEMRWNW